MPRERRDDDVTILRFFRPRDWGIIAVCVATIVGTVYFDLRIPEYMADITYHLQKGDAPPIIAECGLAMVECAVVSLVLSLITSLLASYAASSLCMNIRDREFKRIATWSRQDIDSFTAASLITRTTNDVNQIMQFVSRGINSIIKAPIIAVWATLKIAGSNFEWTAVTAGAFIVLLISCIMVVWRSMPYTRRMQWFVDSVNAETREELEGARTIRAFNAEDVSERSFEKASSDLLHNAIGAERHLAVLHPVADAVQNFLTMAIYWIGAGIIVTAGDVDTQMVLFSDMMVFTTYAVKVLGAVMMATGIMRSLPNTLVSSRRVQDVIDHETSVRDGPLEASDATEPGRIVFDHVSFRYPGTDRDVLKDVSFTVEKGQTLAVIGPTASGKSTIADLIPRMYDATSGTVSVGGHDVREYSADELDSMIGYVPQTPVVFSGSLRRNIAFGSRRRSDEEVARAVRIAQLDELVDRMPEGVDTDVLQHGWSLSGGQKQRLSIARAVCKDPSIYVFDDTFSALDPRTDRDLRRALSEGTAGSTKVVVAQRVGTILDADLILVIEDGRIVGSGRHEELMETCDLYREIARSQLEDFDDRSREGREAGAAGAGVGPRRIEAQEPDGRPEVPLRLHGRREEARMDRHRVRRHRHRAVAHRAAGPRCRHGRDLRLHT